MIEPVNAISSSGPGAGQRESAPPEPPAAPAAEAADAAPSTPKPLSIDVARGSDGVFVYTLRDPGTGAVLAVIPREDVRVDRDGRILDQRV